MQPPRLTYVSIFFLRLNKHLIDFDMQACADDNCLCNNATVTLITACQQCMFDDLIHRFKTSTDPRVGSAPALSGER